MLQNLLTLAILILGLVTVVISVAVARKFHYHSKTSGGDSRRLSVALALQLWGEALLGVGTLTFAIAAHFGWIDHWDIYVQSALRCGMFLASGVTTVHLSRTLARISRG